MQTSTRRPPASEPVWADQPPPTERLAVVALVLAIASFVVLPVLPALAALGVAMRARRRLDEADDALAGRGLVRAACVLAVLNVVATTTLVVVLHSAAAQMEARGERVVRVQSLRAGQCFDLAPGGNVLFATVVPCGGPHRYEAYATFDDPAPHGAPCPGDEQSAEMAFARCVVRFPGFVGRSYEGSSLGILRVVPNQRSWTDQDDRRLLCAVTDRSSQRLTSSARDTSR